jgi:hypothetical protein
MSLRYKVTVKPGPGMFAVHSSPIFWRFSFSRLFVYIVGHRSQGACMMTRRVNALVISHFHTFVNSYLILFVPGYVYVEANGGVMIGHTPRKFCLLSVKTLFLFSKFYPCFTKK